MYSKYYDISECVRRAWSTCVPGKINSADDNVRSWRGLNASLSYLCNHAKSGYHMVLFIARQRVQYVHSAILFK